MPGGVFILEAGTALPERSFLVDKERFPDCPTTGDEEDVGENRQVKELSSDWKLSRPRVDWLLICMKNRTSGCAYAR